MNLVGHRPLMLNKTKEDVWHTERRSLAFWLAYRTQDSIFCQWEDTWPTKEIIGIEWIGHAASDAAEKELRGNT